MKKVMSFVLAIVSFALIASCAVPASLELDVPSLSWEEFNAAAVMPMSVDGETRYLIEGDILATSEEEVRAYYDTIVGNTDEGADARSGVNYIRVGKSYVFDIYNTTVRQNLTYTIDPTISTEVRNDLVWALDAWEAVANIHFVNVTGTSTTPLFKLRNATASEEAAAPGVIASAFFPSYAKKELILYADFYELFSNGGLFYGWNSKSVLVHELGHGIGLRHEFIWTLTRKGWSQTGETTAKAYLLTTARDDYSIMYYPQYSAYKGNGFISAGDITGVTRLYP